MDPRQPTRPRLTTGQRTAIGGGLLLAFSLLALPWFAVTVDGFVQPGRDGAAFELLGGIDVVLLLAAMVPLVIPALRAATPSGGNGERSERLVLAAGGLAIALTIYVVAAPPEPDVVVSAALESSAELSLEPRIGALVGLVAGLAILAGGALATISPAAVEQTPTPERSAPKPKPKPKQSSKPKAGSATKAKPEQKLKPKRRTSKARAAPSPEHALLRLATATAEDLVTIGFSATQAQRIVRYRDEEAIVTSIGDLKRVPGIAKPVLAELVKRLTD